MFCSEVNSAGYSEIEEPIRLRKKHYPPAKYMLSVHIGYTYGCNSDSQSSYQPKKVSLVPMRQIWRKIKRKRGCDVTSHDLQQDGGGGSAFIVSAMYFLTKNPFKLVKLLRLYSKACLVIKK